SGAAGPAAHLVDGERGDGGGGEGHGTERDDRHALPPEREPEQERGGDEDGEDAGGDLGEVGEVLLAQLFALLVPAGEVFDVEAAAFGGELGDGGQRVGHLEVNPDVAGKADDAAAGEAERAGEVGGDVPGVVADPVGEERAPPGQLVAGVFDDGGLGDGQEGPVAQRHGLGGGRRGRAVLVELDDGGAFEAG